MAKFQPVNTLLEGWPWFTGSSRYAISAYSEFMPPPRLGHRPYGSKDALLFQDEDPWGWHVTEYEERVELYPGLETIAQLLLEKMIDLASGRPSHGIPGVDLETNPYWPKLLADHVGSFDHEHFVLVISLALARTQDDKGRVRWTLFGSSEQGPERAFWKGFSAAAGRELLDERFLNFLRGLLKTAFDVPNYRLQDVKALGLRILPTPGKGVDLLPAAVMPLLLRPDEPIENIRFLLTFRPFAELPSAI